MISKAFRRLLYFFCLFLILSLIGCESDSDEELINNFKSNRSEFNKLVKMLETDKNLKRISPTFTWQTDKEKLIYYESDSDFTEQRWNEYREIFAKLKLKEGLIRSKNPENILFFIGESKGIVYCDCELEPLYESLNNIEPTKLKSSRYLVSKN